MPTLTALFVGLGSIGTRHLNNLHALCQQRGVTLRADALWSRDMLEACRAESAPALKRIVVAIDPPASSRK